MMCTPNPRLFWVNKKYEMRVHVAHMRERRGAYWVFEGKPEGRRPFGRCRHRWDDNTKMNLQAIRWGGVDWLVWFRTGTNVEFLRMW